LGAGRLDAFERLTRADLCAGEVCVDPPHTCHDLFVEAAVGGQEIAEQRHEADDEGEHYGSNADLQRLHVGAGVWIEDKIVGKPSAESDAKAEERQRQEAEGLNRPIHAVGAKNYGAVATKVLGNRRKKPGVAGLCVGLDLHVLDHEPGVAGLDHGFKRVGKIVVHK